MSKSKVFKYLKVLVVLFFVSITWETWGGDLKAQIDSPKADIGVVFSEVLYDSADFNEDVGEWIELYNSTASEVNVGGWTIRDNHQIYTIPACTVIASNGYLVITRGRTYFNQQYGFYPHLSNLNLELSNDDDYLTLKDKQGNVRDRVAWESGGTHVSGWGSSSQPQADEGKSIVRSNLNQDTGTYADWANNQTPSPSSNTLPPGTPEIKLSNTELNFEADRGSEIDPQTFTITNSGCGTLKWQLSDNATWLTCGPASGTGAGTVEASVDTDLAGGTYTGTITVSDSNASNSPQTVSVSLTIYEEKPQITLNPTQLYFDLACRDTTDSKTFSISYSGGGTLEWTVTENSDWLNCSPGSGIGSGTVTVTVDKNGLAEGTYTGTITVSDPNASNSPQTVSVSLTVHEEPEITLDPTEFSFNLECGGATDSATFSISNSGCGTLDWTVTENSDWLDCSPASGSGPGTVTVSVDTSSLMAGTYTGTVTVSDPDASNTPQSVSVSLTVDGDCRPEMRLNRTQLYFGAAGGTVTCSPQAFLIDNSGMGTLNWTVSDNVTWAGCSPVSGTGSGVVTVLLTAFSTNLEVGTYMGIITVSDDNASNSPQIVSITLTVHAADAPPFGIFSTPVDNSTVRSSIPVTGWVLDDVGVESVKIYRQTNGGNGLAYVGDAVFVEGARPDVEQAYPQYPLSYKAGWGYMMLTHFLSVDGDGTFVLEVKARDCAGYEVTLGTKTIIVDNANAVKPFGAIDTPAQGGAASGSNYRNHGWVLTPQPNKIPEDGSTINVYVDGVNLGHPVYNIYRTDVAERFPDNANSNGAGAYFDFDTTAYANGVHTIYWTATDNAGNTDGIGSRYFSIQNSQGARSIAHGAWSMEHSAWRIAQSAACLEPVEIRRGYRKEVEPEEIYPGDNGIIHIEINELERLEIHLGDLEVSSFYSGYQLVGDQFKPLPIGSTLDMEKGIFYWLPGPGFMGEYEFLFTKEEGKVRIKVRILPKFSD